MEKKKEIPIFFTIDDGYAPLCGTAIQSIIENASKDYNYKIIIIYKELNEENKKKLLEFENENFKIELKYMKDGMNKITDRKENKLRCDYFTLTIYFRLFIPEMFPEYDKGIYIDSDIVVPGDISELYNIELGDNLIGASTDMSIQDVPELINYMENAVGVKKKEYINSGVLLMNLKELRKEELSDRFLKLLDKYHFDCIAPDQDYLNALCNGKICYLDERWDAMPTEGKDEFKNPKLIHYNLFQKPWCYDDIQYEDYFWKYAKQTKYYDEIKERKNNYSAEQKKSDTKCFNALINKADTLPNTDITFKKIFENGENVRL